MPKPVKPKRFSWWLADTLRDERERAGQPVELVAYVLGVNVRTIERFEDSAYRGADGEKPYGADIDRMVATYAYLLGLDDARDLWQLALDRWRSEGPPPDFMADHPAAKFVAPLREAAQGQRRSRPEQLKRPVSKASLREAR